MDIIEKIKFLALEKGTTMANIEKTLGLGNSSIRRWNTNSPSCNKALLVANYLSVSLDWLVNDELDLSDIKKANMPFFSLSTNLTKLLQNASKDDLDKIEKYLEIVTTINSNTLNHSSILKESFSSYTIGRKQIIPVRGYVAAGTPIEAISNDLGNTESFSSDVDYALIVSGNSMYPLINDGDYVYVKSTKELENGDIGVFYYNGSVTCKKFFKNDSILKLISINPNFEDFTFSLSDQKNEFLNFSIEGKVILSDSQKKSL